MGPISCGIRKKLPRHGKGRQSANGYTKLPDEGRRRRRLHRRIRTTSQKSRLHHGKPRNRATIPARITPRNPPRCKKSAACLRLRRYQGKSDTVSCGSKSDQQHPKGKRIGTTHAKHPLFPKVPPAETPIRTNPLPTTTNAIIPLVQCPQMAERQSGTNGPQPHQSPSVASAPNGSKPRQRPTAPLW